MPQLKTRPQRAPFTPRQVARFLAIALQQANFIEPGRDRQDEILAVDHQPHLLFSTADGREFLVTVTEVEASDVAEHFPVEVDVPLIDLLRQSVEQAKARNARIDR